MKRRLIIACCTAVLFSLSLALGQSKNDCASKCPAGSSASCPMHGTKASLSLDSKNAKECPMKDVKNAGDCTAADKANCNMSKASMTKTGAKAGCCTMKAKGAEAKNSVKKSGTRIAENKGTN
jgi:hypothetical protein